MGDAEYLAAFDALLMPICRQVPPAPHHLPLSPALHLPLYLPSISPLSSLYLACISPISQFAPDLVLVSCGFDAAAGDPLGGMALTRTRTLTLTLTRTRTLTLTLTLTPTLTLPLALTLALTLPLTLTL